MSTQELRAALSAPDNSASRSRLARLTSCDVSFSDSDLPAIAVEYAKVFCDEAASALRRRWVGLVLCKLIRTSASVVEHLKASPPRNPKAKSREQPESSSSELAHIGPVILEQGQLEETRIVAGLVIREALAQGIGILKCWPTMRIPYNSIFPPNDIAHGPWMSAFQTWLDELVDMKVAELDTDCAILYPVSISTSDDFTAVQPVALVQDRKLTVFTLDPETQAVNVLDVPLAHVLRANLQKSTLHDTQQRETELEPWDAVIVPKPGCTYYLNGTEATGEITILFRHRKDAVEFESCINEMSPSEPGAKSPKSDHRDGVDDNEGQASAKVLVSSQRKRRGPKAAQDPAFSTRTKVDTDLPSKAPSRLRAIKKPTVSNGASNKAAFEPDCAGHLTVFDIPDGSPSMKRPAQASNTGSSVQKPKPKRLWGGTNGILAESLLKNGPTKSRLSSRAREEVHDTEDEDDASNSQVSAKPVTRRQAQAPTASVGPKKSRLSNASRPGSRVSSQEKLEGDGVFDLPSDEKDEPQNMQKKRRKDEALVISSDKVKPRKRRKVVAEVEDDDTCDETPSSEPESSGSDYVETKAKARRPAGKRVVPARKNIKPTKDGKVPNARGVGRKKQMEPRSVSPEKHAVLSALVSKPQRLPRQPLTKKPAKDVIKEHRNASSPPDVTNEAETLHRLNDDLPETDESPLVNKARAVCNTSAVPHPLPEDAAMNDKGTGARRQLEIYPPRTSTTSKKRRVDVSMAPENPRTPKRRKSNLPPDPPTTMAPPKTLCDPRSPTVDMQSHRADRTRTPRSPLGNHVRADQTPLDRPLQRTISHSSNAEVLSSNSKPLPGQSNAESTAISGHADREDMDLERELGNRETAKSDPFGTRSKGPNPNTLKQRFNSTENSFIRRTNSVEEAFPVDEDLDMDGDETLVTPEEEGSLPMGATPTHYASSPPRQPHSPSSHSSTSAVPVDEPSGHEDSSPTLIEDEEQEWEASLKPHQLAIGMQLTRVTRRVMQHIVDSETAVHDIEEMYADDGKTVVNDLRKRHDKEFARKMGGVQKMGKVVKKELKGTAAKLLAERKRLGELPKWLGRLMD